MYSVLSGSEWLADCATKEQSETRSINHRLWSPAGNADIELSIILPQSTTHHIIAVIHIRSLFSTTMWHVICQCRERSTSPRNDWIKRVCLSYQLSTDQEGASLARVSIGTSPYISSLHRLSSISKDIWCGALRSEKTSRELSRECNVYCPKLYLRPIPENYNNHLCCSAMLQFVCKVSHRNSYKLYCSVLVEGTNHNQQDVGLSMTWWKLYRITIQEQFGMCWTGSITFGPSVVRIKAKSRRVFVWPFISP